MAFWDDNLLTGIDEIDNQHKELCHVSSELFSSFVEGKCLSKIEPILLFFERYVNEHFEAEENFQQKIKFPFYEQHKEEHDTFKKHIQEFRISIQKEGVTEKIAQKFNLEIMNWLIFHFRETDGLISKFVKDNNCLKQARL